MLSVVTKTGIIHHLYSITTALQLNTVQYQRNQIWNLQMPGTARHFHLERLLAS